MSTVLGLNLASQRTAGMISQCLCGFSPVASQSWSVHISLIGVCVLWWTGSRVRSGLDGRITPRIKPTTSLSGPSLVSSCVPWEEADMCFPRSPSRHCPDIQQRGRLSSAELQITATNYTNSTWLVFFLFNLAALMEWINYLCDLEVAGSNPKTGRIGCGRTRTFVTQSAQTVHVSW